MNSIFTRTSFAVFSLAIVLLAGCGGGGDAGNSAACTGSSCNPAQTSQSQSTSAASSTTFCGFDVGPKLLEGFVTDVHDGDTVTLSSGGAIYKIRLDSIDAPELAQSYSSLSQSTLASAVLGKPVRVAYSKTDQYDRVVGAVFTDGCQYVNLNQVSQGMAWFYKAYQCEISAAVRLQFSQAQDHAVASKLGLWSQADPEAPWFFRNGFEPVTPVCLASTVGTAPVVVAGPSPASGICYTGPRGGTYTLNADGTKNYGGC